MKNFISNLSSRGRYALSCVAVAGCKAVVGITSAFAQADNVGAQLIDGANQSMKSLAQSVVSFLRIVMGIGALIALVLAIINFIKGERDAAQKVGYWVIGLAVGFVFLSILEAMLFSIPFDVKTNAVFLTLIVLVAAWLFRSKTMR